MRRKLLSIGILVFSLAPVAAVAAQPTGDPAAGQNKSRLCNGCHAIATTLKDQDIADLAAYFSGKIQP